MRILITGGSGLLGQYLNLHLSIENEILTVHNSTPGNCLNYMNMKTDLTGFNDLRNLFSLFNPEILIHTAAISRPEECDRLPVEHVLDINFNLNKHLTELCNEFKCRFIFTSTDLVYDGDSGMYLEETSKLNPLSLYAKTKLDSENYISDNSEDYIILRTSLLYGIGLNGSTCNFHQMLNKFKRGEKVNLFHDQYRTPLSLNDAALVIRKIVNSDIKNIILNFGGSERVSRAELGEMTCDVFKYDNSLIEKISLKDAEVNNKVYDVSMNTELLNSFGIKQTGIEESIINIYQEELNGNTG
ncbi:MAG: SDR family oxidoreductase [Ignavibacteria bacterium]|nr:SDR family oxidoreductase [Ignavibacteria bacterium]